jgi:tetratricopeptide (TPR) repeat protein
MELFRRHLSLLLPLVLLLSSLAVACSGIPAVPTAAVASDDDDNNNASGPDAFRLGEELFQRQEYERAAAALWRSVLLHEQTPPDQKYDVQRAFQWFLQCYAAQNRVVDGFAFVAEESFRRGQFDMGKKFLEQALAVDPSNADAVRLRDTYLSVGLTSSGGKRDPTTADLGRPLVAPDVLGAGAATFDEETMNMSPEELYRVASEHFSAKEYEVRARSGKEGKEQCVVIVF